MTADEAARHATVGLVERPAVDVQVPGAERFEAGDQPQDGQLPLGEPTEGEPGSGGGAALGVAARTSAIASRSGNRFGAVTVVAMLALFVAMGGTAIAAGSASRIGSG